MVKIITVSNEKFVLKIDKDEKIIVYNRGMEVSDKITSITELLEVCKDITGI